MPTVDFQPLWRPQKISWIYPQSAQADVLGSIRSKHSRQFLRSIDAFLEEQHMEVEAGPCSPAEFETFLELYRQRIGERGFEVIATTAWYQAKLGEGKQVERMFIKQAGKLVGAKIITVKGSEVRSAFKASMQLPVFNKIRNASLGLILDYLMLEHYVKQKPSLLMAGSSRNLFGVINTLGYPIFKLRMGYVPTVLRADTVFDRATDVPERAVWMTFLTPKAEVQQPLSLYYQGDLNQFSQAPELSRLIELQPLPSKT